MTRSWKLWGALGLLLTLGLVYSPALRFQRFVYDGGRVVAKQPVVLGSWSLSQILKTDYWGRTRQESIGSYRPFAVADLWLEYQLFGPRPDRFAITQILWMFGVCLWVVAFARLLGLSAGVSWLAGFLFALHPVHTEVVASIAGRADLLMAFLFLLALWLHRSTHSLAGPLNLVVVFLGLSSKELFVIFPALAFAFDLFKPPNSSQTSQEPRNTQSAPSLLHTLKNLPWLTYVLYGVVTLLFFWMRHKTIGTIAKFPHGAHDNPLLTASWWIKLLNAPMLLWRYVELLLFPVSLSPDRTYNAVPILTSPLSWRLWAGTLLLAGLIALGLRLRSPSIRILLVFALLAYLPISNTVVTGPIIMADRWLFLVSIPFCIGLAMGFYGLLTHFPRWRTLWVSAGIILILAWAGITYDYTQQWRSSLTLFRYASQHTPNSLKARYIYAQELLNAQKPRQAMAEFRAALRIKPGFSLAYFGLSEAHERLGQLQQAEQILRDEVQRQGTRSPNARIRLVLFLRRHRRFQEAQQVDMTIRRDFAQWLRMMQTRYKGRH